MGKQGRSSPRHFNLTHRALTHIMKPSPSTSSTAPSTK